MSFPNVFAILSADVDVSAAVGERIGAHGTIEAGETRPYITHQFSTINPNAVLDGGSAVDIWGVQVDCCAPSQAGVKALAEAVRKALESVCYVTSCDDAGRDQTTGVYRFSWTFDFIQ